jgi:uncharacterized protein (DUF1778 family)
MARPEKEKELSRSHHITLRLTETQFQTITDAAKEAKLSRSDYIRQQLTDAAYGICKEELPRTPGSCLYPHGRTWL